MTDSVPIPLDVLAETQAALDCALALVEESAEAYGKVMKARAKLDAVINEKSVEKSQTGDTIQRRSELKKVRDELLTLARRLEKVEKAA
jgi:hypothetical protein